jgi:hypothetical protein
MCSRLEFAKHNSRILPFSGGICLRGTLSKDVKFQNSEYEDQVGPKNLGKQNFSFLAFKGEAVGRAKRRVTEGKKIID